MWQSSYYPLGSHFISEESLTSIESHLQRLPLESITVGDAGEINNCQVGRLVEDIPGKLPTILNSPFSDSVLSNFTCNKAVEFFEQFVLSSDQIVRRCQVNLLGEGSFVGRHLDVDSNPDYDIAAVLQLGSSFEGGDFVVYKDKSLTSDTQIISPQYGSLTVSFCNYEHEVKEVTKGLRSSLVAFISAYKGINRRA